jgi:hypothetical protein
VAAQEVVDYGLIINAHCKELTRYTSYWNGSARVRRPVYRTVSKTAMITVTYEEATMLIHVLTLRKHFLTIDLKDTELFNVPDIWEKLGMANKAHKKLFLVLTDAKSPKFEKKERSL